MLTRTFEMNFNSDRVGIHHGALNFNPLAIIGGDKIAQQVLDQTGIDKEIYFLKDHLYMASNLGQYIVNYTAELDDIKNNLNNTIDAVKTLSQNNGVPVEVWNSMMVEAGYQYASMRKLGTNFKYPSLETAQHMLGKISVGSAGPITTTTPKGKIK